MILPFVAVVVLLVVTAYAAVVGFGPPEGRQPKWIFPKNTGRATRIVIGALTIASVIGFGLLMANNASTSARPSSRFLIPQDFTGWVRVEFEVNGAPPLPLENGAYVLRISAAGTLRTSSPEQYGWANDRYCYYSAQGLHSLADSGPSQFIWGKLNAEASGPAGQRKYEEFFVGTGQQFREQSEPHNPSGKR